MKKKYVLTAQDFRSIQDKTFLTLEISQFRKSGSTFSSSDPDLTLPAATAAKWETQCLCWPVWTAQAVQERGPKSLAIDLASKTLDCFLE